MACQHLEQADVVLVELVEAELRDHGHTDHARTEAERNVDLGLVDAVGSLHLPRQGEVRGVTDQQRLAGRRHVSGDALAELAREYLHRRLRAGECADERDRPHVLFLDDEHAAVVVVDQRAQLGRDHVADLAHVVQAVQLAAEALQHLHVGDRPDVARRRLCRCVGPFE